MNYLVANWTFRGMPETGDDGDPRKNYFLFSWFLRHYGYDPGEVAQLLGVSGRTVHRWHQHRAVPRRVVASIRALTGQQRAELAITRRRR